MSDGAIITSSLSPDEMRGSLEASVRLDYWPFASPGTYEYSQPVHDVTFALAESRIISLYFFFYGSRNGWLDTEAALYRDGAVVMGGSSIDLDSLEENADGFIGLDYTTTLEPGVYRLVVGLYPLYTTPPEPGFHSTYQVTSFQFQIVPEPAAGTLLALGLLRLSGIARRLRRAGAPS